MNDLQNPTPGETTTANPATDPATSTGTVQLGGEANGQSAPAEEMFGNVDPKTLPPQLKAVYDNMLRGFKEKTTKVAEEVKKYADYDSLKQKSGFYDQFTSQPDAVKWWNEFVKNAGASKGQPGDPNEQLRAEVEEVKSKLQKAEMSEIIDAFADAKDEKGEPLNPDFDLLHTINVGSTAEGNVSLLKVAIGLAQGKTAQERIANGYKNAKAIRDALLEEGRKQGMGKMLSKVRNSTEAPATLSTDKGVFTGNARELTARQARELAEKRVAVR